MASTMTAATEAMPRRRQCQPRAPATPRRPISTDAPIGPAHQRRPFPQHADRRERPRTARTASRRHRRRRSRAAPAPAPSTTRSDELAAAGPRSRRAADRRIGAPPRSRSGPRDQAAEPALAAAIFGDRAFERGAVEIRPIGRHEHELAVGRLPQQEIRQPLLAAGADDQVGIGQIRRIEIAARACPRSPSLAASSPAATAAAMRCAARAISWRAP